MREERRAEPPLPHVQSCMRVANCEPGWCWQQVRQGKNAPKNLVFWVFFLPMDEFLSDRQIRWKSPRCDREPFIAIRPDVCDHAPLMAPDVLPPLIPPKSLPPLPESVLPSLQGSSQHKLQSQSVGSPPQDAPSSGATAAPPRDRARRALLAAEASGRLRKLVVKARSAEPERMDRTAGRDADYRLPPSADDRAAAAAAAWSTAASTARPRWQLWLIALEAAVLIGLLVAMVGGAAYTIGRCATAAPWVEDSQRPRCLAASGLALLLLMLCTWATADRHCCQRRRRRHRHRPPSGSTSTRIASGKGAVAPAVERTAMPQPEDLMVEFTTSRRRPPQQQQQQQRQQQQQQRERDKDGASEVLPGSSYKRVSVGALVAMVIAGALPPHTRVRAAVVQPAAAEREGEEPRRPQQPRQEAPEQKEKKDRNKEKGASIPNVDRKWVAMDSFIDMAAGSMAMGGGLSSDHDALLLSSSSSTGGGGLQQTTTEPPELEEHRRADLTERL